MRILGARGRFGIAVFAVLLAFPHEGGGGVVVPSDRIDEVLEEAAGIRDRESRMEQMIRNGRTIAEARRG